MARRRCKLVRKSGAKMRGCYVSCRVRAPSAFDPRSFRTIARGSVYLVIGCPKGKWDAKRKRCRVGTKAQRVDRPATGCAR